MYLIDVLRLSSKALSEKKLRAILTIIGIAIGPMALVMINSVTSGYSKYIVEQIKGLGQNLIVITPREDFKLSDSDLKLLRNLDGVADAEPFYSTQGTMSIDGEEETVFIYAVDFDFLFKAIPSLRIREGVIPSPSELATAIIGYDIGCRNGRKVYYLGDAVGMKVIRVKSGGEIEVKHVSLIVRAILEKYGGAAFLNPDQTVFISMETARRILGARDWSGILILAEDPMWVHNITNTIKNIYGNSVEIISFLAIAQIASSITGAVNFMTFAASLAAFAVAIAGVAATMITSVIERTREIGVMKALGFTDGQVLLLIIFEGIIMSLIGGAIGITLGSLGAYIMASKGLVLQGMTQNIVIKAPPEITPQTIGLTVLLTMLVGIAGSIFPAYRAAKIPPAVALRYE